VHGRLRWLFFVRARLRSAPSKREVWEAARLHAGLVQLVRSGRVRSRLRQVVVLIDDPESHAPRSPVASPGNVAEAGAARFA
jgi:hypothetical protein